MNISTLQIITETLRQANLSTTQIYHYLLNQFEGTPYSWGGNSLHGSDCSGSVCAALSYATNNFIRVPADDLYRRIFTRPVMDCSKYPMEISAAYFLDETGKAIHVAGYCGNKLFMNVSRLEPNRKGTLRTMEELRKMYPHLKIVTRMLREDYANESLQKVA